MDVRIGSEGTPADGDAVVGPGTWEIDWFGYAARKTFTVEGGETAHVRLGTTTGRCERVAKQCRVRGAVSKTVAVAVR